MKSNKKDTKKLLTAIDSRLSFRNIFPIFTDNIKNRGWLSWFAQRWRREWNAPSWRKRDVASMAGRAIQSLNNAKDASVLWNFPPENFAPAIRILPPSGEPAPAILLLIPRWRRKLSRKSIRWRPPKETTRRSKVFRWFVRAASSVP